MNSGAAPRRSVSHLFSPQHTEKETLPKFFFSRRARGLNAERPPGAPRGLLMAVLKWASTGLAGQCLHFECRGAPARVRVWRCEGRPPLPHHVCVCGEIYLTLP